MKKIRFSFYFVFVAVLTFLTVFFLLVQKSYFNFRKPQNLVENDSLLKTFNPNLDLTVISEIESKESNTDESFDFSVLASDELPSETPVPEEESTSSATEAAEATEAATPN